MGTRAVPANLNAYRGGKNMKTSHLSMPAIFAGIVALVLTVAAPAFAQADYPNRPIRLITPAAPGGTTDFLARLFGAKLSDIFKEQVIVDNRASASGVFAGELTAAAAP